MQVVPLPLLAGSSPYKLLVIARQTLLEPTHALTRIIRYLVDQKVIARHNGVLLSNLRDLSHPAWIRVAASAPRPVCNRNTLRGD